MKRRDAIKKITIFTGGVIFLSAGIMPSCTKSASRDQLSEEDIVLLDQIGETIIPETDKCGGAKAAKIGIYMRLMVDECLTKEDRRIFLEGLTLMENSAMEQFKDNFLKLNPAQKKKLFLNLQTQAETYNKNKGNNLASNSIHYFDLFKKLTVDGYFTSEIGATKARRYQAVPGKYKGCISYKKGDKAWATS
ncbi:gluconate 2-dehydrogenase subunit 3 family protein [Pedobacter petrophilus]|uniref:Gluconate 2-dehydrogenase subunit 3 family protein n=2 Tax=Pedobacter TaxID=84567 RepID=A0A7K0G2F7_9SPHI|nr:gluconate 2-dehydrogenase subunit 3 family protein [Pedobacter petrophilus]MRX78007.1 gluconate 2-dehydrogenase subunit 3 family protein [Pedobacter petrophilus]